MTEVISFVVENWYWVLLGIILLPSLCWQLLVSVVSGVGDGLQIESFNTRFLKYSEFWKWGVRQRGWSNETGWGRILSNKFTRIVNLVSLFWIWGYVLFLVTFAISRFLKWIYKLVAFLVLSVLACIRKVWKAV